MAAEDSLCVAGYISAVRSPIVCVCVCLCVCVCVCVCACLKFGADCLRSSCGTFYERATLTQHTETSGSSLVNSSSK